MMLDKQSKIELSLQIALFSLPETLQKVWTLYCGHAKSLLWTWIDIFTQHFVGTNAAWNGSFFSVLQKTYMLQPRTHVGHTHLKY